MWVDANRITLCGCLTQIQIGKGEACSAILDEGPASFRG